MSPDFGVDSAVLEDNSYSHATCDTFAPQPPPSCAVLAPRRTIQVKAPFHLFYSLNIIMGVLVLVHLCHSRVGCYTSAAPLLEILSEHF